MAVYKVIQDIEAEDKILGPLTLKQFIFTCAALFSGFVAFTVANSVHPVASIPILPFVIMFGLLAAPLSKDQPTDVWLSARIRFMVKPKRRIWDQSGLEELVTITAPKHEEKHLTKDLSQGEVESRLSALASTLDSRGWAVKGASVNLYTQPSYFSSNTSDRLIAGDTYTLPVPDVDIREADDMLDARNNPAAQKLDQMMRESSEAHRAEVVARMRERTDTISPAQPVVQSYTGNLGMAAFDNSAVISPGANPDQYLPSSAQITSAEDQALLAQLHHQQTAQGGSIRHLRNINSADTRPVSAPDPSPISPPATPVNADYQTSELAVLPPVIGPTMPTYQIPQPAAYQPPEPPVTYAPAPAIVELARNNDFSVATLASEAARQAQKSADSGQLHDDDVISLR